jgi:hypothetical protein
MTVLHLQSTTGPDGTVHVGDVPMGVPDAEVDITLTVKERISDEQWRKEMREILDSMGDIHVESYPRHPLRDPWSEA